MTTDMITLHALLHVMYAMLLCSELSNDEHCIQGCYINADSLFTSQSVDCKKMCLWSTKLAQQSQRTHSADLVDRNLAENVYNETSTNMLPSRNHSWVWVQSQ